VKALVEAIEAAEQHLKDLGFDVSRLHGAAGFERIEALRDATNAVYTADEAKRRFEILARLVFARFKALLMEPTAFTYAERHDNLEAVYRKLQERRDTSDVTELLKELHKIVNEAIRTQETGEDHAEGLMVDLSQLDFQKLRDEFAKVRRKQALLQDIREMVEQKLQQMLRYNPQGMDYYKKYQEIIADYNREKDRTTVEEAFVRLFDMANSLDAEQQRAAQEGLSRDELALFDLLSQPQISKADRERLKQASKRLLASLQELLKPMENWTQKEQTQAEVKVFILDRLFETLPNPPYSTDETQAAADHIYEYIWQRSANGSLFPPDMAA
jgi:type I restriction enzyme R subunit